MMCRFPSSILIRCSWIFHYKFYKPSSSWGAPMTMETPTVCTSFSPAVTWHLNSESPGRCHGSKAAPIGVGRLKRLTLSESRGVNSQRMRANGPNGPNIMFEICYFDFDFDPPWNQWCFQVCYQPAIVCRSYYSHVIVLWLNLHRSLQAWPILAVELRFFFHWGA